MSTQNRRDMLYGRRGGGWVDGGERQLTGPPCSVCGRPMIAGQRGRHHVCSPDTLVAMVCTCPPNCTDARWGDGPRDCDPECEACRLMVGMPYSTDYRP